MTKPKFLGIVEIQHSPLIFIACLVVFTLIYWYLGPTHFYDNVGKGTDIRGAKLDFTKDDSIFDYAYFAIVVQSLLGFGDIIPATRTARFCVCVQIITSMYLLLSTGSAILIKV